MKKILAILLAMVMTFGLLTGCNKSQPDKPNGGNSDIVIGVVVNNLEHVFFNRIKAGMEEKAAELGVTLKLIDGAGDSAVQMAAVQDFIAAGVDAIAVAWCNTDGSGSIVELATTEGGRMAAEYCLKNILTDGTGNCIIIPYEEVESCRNRAQGFIDYMAKNAPEMKVDQIASFSGNREIAYNAFQDALTARGAENIDFVFGVGDDAVLGAITACEEANVEIPMIGLDGNPEAERNVAAGGMFKADVAQAAHDIGTITIETIMSHLNGQSVDADILVAPKMITPENADPNA